MAKVFVVLATFEFDATAYSTELIGVFHSQVRAFEAMENFNYMKIFERTMIGEVMPGHTYKEFGADGEDAYYSEQHYVSTEKDGGGSVTITIFEKEVE